MADLQEIGFALEAMRTLTEKIIGAPLEEPLVGDLRKEDVWFHVAIMTAAKNDLMKKEILRLHLVNRVVSGPAALAQSGAQPEPPEDANHRRAVLKSHQDIFEAIAAGRVEDAKREMEQHIQDIIDRSIYRLARASADVSTRELSAEEAIYNA